MIGLSCLRRLWMLYYQKEKIPEYDAVTQYRFSQGHIVGNLAKELFPSGISCPEDFKENIVKTKELLKRKKPLFEAGLSADDLYARADILVPAGDKWDIIEVKASTQVKEEHLDDVAFQKYVYEKVGLKIRKCFLLHINKEFVKKGPIEPKMFFVQEEITEDLATDTEENIKKMLEVLSHSKPPQDGCNLPKECIIKECWDFLPEHHVFHLYRGGKRSLELYQNGIHALADIPAGFKLNEKQQIQLNAVKHGPHIHKEKIKEFLAQLEKPIYYLDFETYSTAVPLFEGCKPYQNIPFQFALSCDGRKEGFLASGKEDPRLQFLIELKKVLGTSGSIVVYNQGFEINRLKELEENFPAYKRWVDEVIKRVVDLLVPFREFAYYHAEQNGSASIKKVLPALTGKGYEEMEIAGGGDASVSFLEAEFGDVAEDERQKIRKDLEKYCALDAQGMKMIVERLKEMTKSNY